MRRYHQRLSFPAWLALFGLITLTVQPASGTSLLDSDGRAIAFEQPFSRIISLYPGHTRNLMDLGLSSEIIAVGRGDEHLPDLPRVGFKDDPERLLALRPDLVLIRPMISRAYPALAERLEQNGVRVVSLQPASMDALFRYWEQLGLLTGRESEARALIARFGQGLATLRAKGQAIPPAKRRTVYFEAIHGRMKTFAPDSIAIFVLEAAGGINAAADATQLRNTTIAEYGKERILSKAETIDVFLAQQGRMNPVTMEMIRDEPAFHTIRAVREGRIFLIDEEVVARPTMELLEGIEKIHGLLYPQEIRVTP